MIYSKNINSFFCTCHRELQTILYSNNKYKPSIKYTTFYKIFHTFHRNVTLELTLNFQRFKNLRQRCLDSEMKSYKGLHGNSPRQSNLTTDCRSSGHTDVRNEGLFNCDRILIKVLNITMCIVLLLRRWFYRCHFNDFVTKCHSIILRNGINSLFWL